MTIPLRGVASKERALASSLRGRATKVREVPAGLRTCATSAPPALLAARTALDDMLKEITTAAARQEESLTGTTRDRDKAFEAAAGATHVLARLLVGPALAQGDETLRAQIDYSRTDLSRGRLGRRVQRLRRALDAAQARVVELADTGLTPALVADAETKVAAAEALIAGEVRSCPGFAPV